MNRPPRTLGADDRALAMQIGIFFATIIIGFLLAMVVVPAAEGLLETSATHTERESSAQGQAYVGYAISNLHFIVIGLGAIQLIVAAVWESQLPGGGI